MTKRWTGRAHALVLLLLASCGPGVPPDQSPEFAVATNIGKAHLENRNATKAIESFRTALELAPDSPLALRNLARAYLLARDRAELLDVLARARALGPESAATHYLSGIAFTRDSKPEQAVEQLEAAARLDPDTAALRFQLASAYRAAERHPEAIRQLREAVRLDPLHTAAHYRLAGYARRAGDRNELERHQRELVRLRGLLGEQDRSPDALERCRYSDAEPPAAALSSANVPGLAVRFDAAPDALPDGSRWIGAAVLEIDEAGHATLVVVASDGQLGLLRPDADGKLRSHAVEAEVPRRITAREPLTVAVANFFDAVPDGVRYDPALHARNDLLVLSPGGALLLEQQRSGGFVDVTGRGGLSELSGSVARWLDYDHDGDVDLAVGRSSGVELWQNGGDGRFEEIAAAVGIERTGAVTDLAAVDLDGDVAVDLVVARSDAPTQVFESQRIGSFARQLEPPGPWPAARRVLIEDLDNDGRPDAVLIGDDEVVLRWGEAGTPERLPLHDLRPRTALVIDADNDGWLDLLVAGEQRAGQVAALRLWRNGGRGAWSKSELSIDLGASDLPPIRDALAADLDDDGDTDLLLMGDAGLRLLRNEGGHVGGQLKLRLQGTKTNPIGIGARVEVRAAGFHTQRFIQSLPIEIGLAGHQQLDSIETVWTNGVVDNQIGVSASDSPLTIVEQNVAAGSCPFLYAWDGRQYRFVTDLLGNSPVGLSLRRGEVLGADPDEFVWVGGSLSLISRDGAYQLKLTDEMREVVYLDQVRLVAVDHAADVEVHPTDRLMPPPFPLSELWALHAPHLPRSARGDDGIDRTAALQTLDGVFSSPGALLPPPLRGKTLPLTLTLDFGPLSGIERPVLALTGWLQYGDASTNIAMSQNRSIAVVPPILEMETADGHWSRVDVTLGMPAGKTKTIAIDLAGKLAPDARRLRLRTSFELRWDRIALFERLPDTSLEIRDLPLISADLAARGFSAIRARAPGHPTTPDHDSLLERPPWRTTPQGWVTRFGDVVELVAARDSQLAVMNGGDSLDLRFGATLPAPAGGRVRTFFFYSVGWDKDADHNVVAGDSVGPLPVRPTAGEDLSLRYNTRWVPRDAPTRMRYDSSATVELEPGS